MSLDFTETNLEEIYDFSSGLSKSVEEFGFGFPFLSFKTIFNNYYIDFDLEDLVNSTDQEQKKHSVKRGDVFLTRTSETLDELAMSCVALKDYPNATFNGFTKRLRPKENKIIYPLYAIYYFRSSLFRKYVDSMATMTTRASLNNNILSKLPIFYPSYDNQIKIGNILHNLSKKIELNKQLNNNLLTISNKLYEEWFLNFEFPNGFNEPYKTNNGEFKDTDLGTIPLDWEVGTLKDLLDFKEKLLMIKDYVSNEKYGSVVSLLLDGELKAKGNNYIIYVYNDSKMTDFFNNKLKDIETFMLEIFKQQFKVISATLNEWEIIKKDFNNSLKNHEKKYTLMKDVELIIPNDKSKTIEPNDIDNMFSEIVKYE